MMKSSGFFRFFTGVFVSGVAIAGVMMVAGPVSSVGTAAASAPVVTPTATPAPPSDGELSPFRVQDNGAVVADGLKFETMSAYFHSPYFQQTGKRCGTKVHTAELTPQAVPDDCTLARTVIQGEYWPYEVYIIPVVFHVIFSGHGQGRISDQRIIDQVQVLNEDFQALSGSLGAEGFDTRIHFQLAGITRTKNDAWFNDTDELAYKQALGWDQDHYLNVYVNTASGYLGYSYLPQDGVDKVYDGVVMLYEVVGGRDTGYDVYDQGRTLVHEIGHYLGLLHTFEGEGCYDGYEAGDLIADTPSEDIDHYGCTQTYSCGTPDDIHNYMNYTDDICMKWFTPEQANRAVCSLVNYRPLLFKKWVYYFPIIHR